MASPTGVAPDVGLLGTDLNRCPYLSTRRAAQRATPLTQTLEYQQRICTHVEIVHARYRQSLLYYYEGLEYT